MSEVAPEIPKLAELRWPQVEALRHLGGSGTVGEISDEVVRREGFTEEQQAVTRGPGDHMTMINYRLAWARNELKNAGFIENSARGVWALTPAGQLVTDRNQLEAVVKEHRVKYQRQRAKKKNQQNSDGPASLDLDAASAIEPKWIGVLLDRLAELKPAGFERLTQHLLREAGFRDVQVLGRSGDGGLDGVGTLRVSLISFPVFFQCKRYQGSVGPGAVRDFRGAMAGRGEKGLLITTGTFTQSAQEEASRDGAPPVELMSGFELAKLLKDYSLGVETRTRQVEDVSVDPSFFDRYDE